MSARIKRYRELHKARTGVVLNIPDHELELLLSFFDQLVKK